MIESGRTIFPSVPTPLQIRMLIKRPSRKRPAFSLLEVIAAVVILAVVAAATVATIAPMREKSSEKLLDQDRANVSAMVQTYYVERGSYPRNFGDLSRWGYINRQTQEERLRYNRLNQTLTIDSTTGAVTKKTP